MRGSSCVHNTWNTGYWSIDNQDARGKGKEHAVMHAHLKSRLHVYTCAYPSPSNHMGGHNNDIIQLQAYDMITMNTRRPGVEGYTQSSWLLVGKEAPMQARDQSGHHTDQVSVGQGDSVQVQMVV